MNICVHIFLGPCIFNSFGYVARSGIVGSYNNCMLNRLSNWPIIYQSICTILHTPSVQFNSVQSLSRVRLFATPWIAACQALLSITNSQSSLRLMSIESVMPSSHLILCRPLLLLPQSFPASESFPMSQLFTWGGQSTGVSALASFLPKKSQGWSPSEWAGWISLQSKGLSRVFSNTALQTHQFFGAQPSSQSNSHIHIWPQEKPFGPYLSSNDPINLNKWFLEFCESL